MFWKCLLPELSMGASTLFAQSASRLDFGRLQTGAAPRIRQPAKLEIYQADGVAHGPRLLARSGGHRFWLPWVSANHLYGITGMEEYDPALFKSLSTKPAAAPNMPPVNEQLMGECKL